MNFYNKKHNYTYLLIKLLKAANKRIQKFAVSTKNEITLTDYRWIRGTGIRWSE